MGNPPPTPPVVTLVNPSGSDLCDPVSTLRTFTASCDQVATMSVYLDTDPGSSSPVLEITNVQQISYTAPQYSTEGNHQISVVAANGNGTGINYWFWNLVESPPVVTRVDPEEQNVSDNVGTQRTFTALCDQSATMTFELDGTPVFQSSPGIQSASYTNSSASAGMHEVGVIASNSNGNGSNHWNWLVLSTTYPPVVTRYNPESQTVNDLVGSSRTFIAAVDQPAIVRFYLDYDFDNPVFESDGFVELASYTNESAPLGTHTVTARAENTNGTGSIWWDWDVSQAAGCHVPSNCGPYLEDLWWIQYYRCGSPNCVGGSGSWNEAVCLQNAIIRYAWAGKSTSYVDKLSCCYWMEKLGCPEYCYLDLNTKIYELDVYIAAVLNSTAPDFEAHAICAEHLGGDMEDWNNWRFFQYSNSNIQPGDPGQMPLGTSTENTRVQIYVVTGIPDCAHYSRPENPEVTFLIDETGDVTLG